MNIFQKLLFLALVCPAFVQGMEVLRRRAAQETQRKQQEIEEKRQRKAAREERRKAEAAGLILPVPDSVHIEQGFFAQYIQPHERRVIWGRLPEGRYFLVLINTKKGDRDDTGANLKLFIGVLRDLKKVKKETYTYNNWLSAFQEFELHDTKDSLKINPGDNKAKFNGQEVECFR